MEADRDLLEVLDAWYDDMRCVSLQNPEKHLEATGHPVLLCMPTFSIWTSSRLKHGLRGLDDAWVPNWPSEIGRCWDVKPIELQSMEKLRPLCHDLCRTKLKRFAKWSDMVSLLKGRIKALFSPNSLLWGSFLGKKRLAAICSGCVPGACPPCVPHVSALCPPWVCFGRASKPCLPCVRHVSAMCPPCVRLVSGICPPLCLPWVRWGRASELCPPCVRHASAMCPPCVCLDSALATPPNLVHHVSAMCPPCLCLLCLPCVRHVLACVRLVSALAFTLARLAFCPPCVR